VTLTDTVGGVTQKPAAGAKIIASSTGVALLKGGLSASCNENILTGTVHRNAYGIVEFTIEDGWFQSNLVAGDASTPCITGSVNAIIKTNLTSPSNHVGTATHWCVKTLAGTDSFEFELRNCTAVSGGEFTYSIAVGALTCGFKRSANVPGTFSTSPSHASVAELIVTGEPTFITDAVTGHSGLCPASVTLANFRFNLYTDTDVTPNGPHPWPGSITDPLYFSLP
jgi:hypothetical protein